MIDMATIQFFILQQLFIKL